MNISPEGVALVQEFEKCRLEAYLDTGGVATIGWGHTNGVEMGDTCTQGQADAWLIEDLANAEIEAEKWVEVELNQGMYDAVVSFEFNTGRLMIAKPQQPSRFLAAINDRRWADAGEELVHWNQDNGRALRGLCRRRALELVMFHRDPWP